MTMKPEPTPAPRGDNGLFVMIAGLGLAMSVVSFWTGWAARGRESPAASPTAHLEASADCYSNVESWLRWYPEIRVRVLGAMADEKLTNEEYEAIDKHVDELRFKRYRQELLDACVIPLDGKRSDHER